MSQAANAWIKLIREVFSEFHVVEMVKVETDGHPQVSNLYPHLRIGLIDSTTHSESPSALYHQAGITVMLIDLDKAPSRNALDELSTLLSAAARRTAQRPMSQDVRFSLLKRIASAKTICRELSDRLPADDEFEQQVETGEDQHWPALFTQTESPHEPIQPETEMPQPTLAIPVQEKERIEFVDILRGFALLGVLVANMAAFSGQPSGLEASSGLDRTLEILISFFVRAKFYSLFSLLFGWGMAMQMSRAEARGTNFLPTYLKRLIILLIFGVVHGALIWAGDILTMYALLGFVLLLFHKRSQKFVLVAAGLMLLLAIVLMIPGPAMDTVREWCSTIPNCVRANTNYAESLFGTGTFPEIARLRLQNYSGAFWWVPCYLGNVFAMFLLGLYIGKREIFRDVRHHMPMLRRVAGIGLLIGVLFSGLAISVTLWPDRVPAEYRRLVIVGTRTIGAPSLMLFYVSGIILLVQKESWYKRLAPLAHVGRSALSNYLLQSVVGTLIFYNYGLGLFGQVSAAFGFFLSIVIFATQIRLSEWWFDSHQFGPMERLWRTLTYGRLWPSLPGEAQPASRLKKLRQSIARAPRIAWILIGVVFIVGLGILSYRFFQTPQNLPSGPLAVGAERAATIDAAESDSPSSVRGEAAAVATPQVHPVDYRPGPIARSGDLVALASTFVAESAYAQIETLTGHPYQGRPAGSAEGRAAGDYLAERFASYGLQAAGDSGTFYQQFPVTAVSLDASPVLVVEGPDGTLYDRFSPHEDFSALAGFYSGFGKASGEAVWANNCSHDDLNNLDAVGKIVLCRDVSTAAAGSQPLSHSGRNALEHGAAGLLLVANSEQHPPDTGEAFLAPLVPVPIPTFRIYPSVAARLLLGSNKSVSDLSINYDSFPLLTRVTVEVKATSVESHGRNVLGVIPGRDPAYAGQVVIVGAHYDHFGASPAGLSWPGANGSASGVAALLEIARSWHAQGYVPRRTVLFAAWDARELDLTGSRYYVENPRYPLDSTVAEIELAAIGGGGDLFSISGDENLAESIQRAAEALGVESETGNSSSDDQKPFSTAKIPAILLSWSPEADRPSQINRPDDTLETIDLDMLAAGGQIAGVALLGLTEGEPAIADLMTRRAAAVAEGDLDLFLKTSVPEQNGADRFWFDDAQSFSPSQFEMQATEIKVFGQSATAVVRMVLEHPIEEDSNRTTIKRVSQRVRFANTENGWQWAGPNLAYGGGAQGIIVAYPPDKDADPVQLGLVATQSYSDVASLLDLPVTAGATLMLFPNTESLRASTAPSFQPSQDSWIGPGTIKMVYQPEISATLEFSQAVVQLVLADAGVTESAAPWLWHGLPAILQEEENPLQAQFQYLPSLRRGLEAGAISSKEAASWAAMHYLRRRIGWSGIGQLITLLGQACQDGLCGTQEGLDLILNSTLELDTAAFDKTWQADWRERLASAQAELDAVLLARTEAVLAHDQAEFLNTVDPTVPKLLIEERHWLAELASHSVETLEIAGEPLAFLDDGSILARVSLGYDLSDVGGTWGDASVSFRTRFTPSDRGLLWAGPLFEQLIGGPITVLYPAGQEEIAAATLDEMGPVYSQLALELGMEEPEPLTIKLYEDDDTFRTSVFPSFPSEEWIPAWTAAGESIKLHLEHSYSTLDAYRAELMVQIGRSLLYQNRVESEWLVKGMSIYLTNSYDAGVTEQTAASNLDRVLRAVSNETVGNLSDMAPDYRLSRDEFTLLNAQAWDAVRYLVHAHGREILTNLLTSFREGVGLETALQRHTGQALSEFEADWAESIPRAHASPAWVETAMAFDQERAFQHVTNLTDPDLSGRQAGAPGAENAAAYIAEQFDEYGLLPAGDGDAFLQTFPISFTAHLATPRLEFIDENGQSVANLTYREEFAPLLNDTSNRADVEAELVWIRDTYEGLDLSGKIVLCRPLDAVGEHVIQAAERGALGVVIIGEIENKKVYLAKRPIPVRFPSKDAIPVLELTQSGYDRLLSATGLTPPVLFNSPPALPLGISVRIELPISTPRNVETANVLGVLPGSDPILSQEIIILGAHYDHVGDDPDGRRYSGANDNASGVGVLLEIARLWQETGYKPQRSVLFAAWGAQELEMAGSRYYIENPLFPLDHTIAMLQLDAVAGGSGHYMEVQGFREQEGLLMFNMQAAEDLVDGRLKLAVPSDLTEVEATGITDLYISPFEGLASQLLNSRPSDQAPFHRLGIPSILVTWRGANEDNWPDEIAEEAEPYRLGVTGRMVTLVLMTTAGQK